MKTIDIKEPRRWFDEDGYLIDEIPQECVADCSAAGSVDSSVSYWVEKLDFNVARHLAIRYLYEWGAWNDLETADDETLAQRVLWLACCDLKEENEWIGLIV